MVVEREIIPFFQWLVYGSDAGPGALLQFLLIAGVLAVLAALVGFAVQLLRYGPGRAADATYRTLSNGVAELTQISPRRVGAIARLTIKEALRRRVLVGIGVFLLILVFASWFLQTNHQDPAKLYLSFVLTATTYLMLGLALLLSVFSLPNDFKSKVIYTIVTKPVRAGDIVLGRVLGFTAVATIMLLIMGVLSYFFVTTSLQHTHTVELANLENINDPNGELIGRTGTTGNTNYHRHTVEVTPDGEGIALAEYGHAHDITTDSNGRLVVQTPNDVLRARVPLRGKIRFLDPKGVETARGISVGNEWAYRSFIEGGSSAAAIWTFEGINSSTLKTTADGSKYLPVELIVRVFRSYKGDVEKAIQGSIQLRNPETGVKTGIRIFPAKDYLIDSFNFQREQTSTDQESIDLLDDLVSSDGKIEVWVQTLDRNQYFGFNQADCYIRLEDGSPVWNFVKGMLSILVQSIIVVTIGVACSTFLSGPIAMMFTVSFIVLGFFREFFLGVARGTEYGGGPLEALVRIVTQKNLTTPFQDSPGVAVMEGIDNVLQSMMQAVALLLPDFRSLTTVNYVAEGFAIPGDALGRQLMIALAYIVGMSIAGYFFLRTREVAK